MPEFIAYDIVAFLVAHWPEIVGIVLAFFASIDKIGLMFFKTIRNLVDYYNESFPKKE